MPFTITVKTLDGANSDYEVEDEATVGDFKATLANAMSIPSEEQRLIFQGRVLQNEAKLADLGCANKVLHLVRRMPQPQQPPPQQQQQHFHHHHHHHQHPDLHALPNHIAQMMEQMLGGVNRPGGGVGGSGVSGVSGGHGASITTRQQPDGGLDVVVNITPGGGQAQSLARLRLGYMNTVLRQMNALLDQLNRVRSGEADGVGEVQPDAEAVRLAGNPSSDRINLPEQDRVGDDPGAPAAVAELPAAIDRIRRSLASLDSGLAVWSDVVSEDVADTDESSSPSTNRRQRRQVQYELASRAAHLGAHALHNLSDLIAELDRPASAGAQPSRQNNLLVLSEAPLHSIQAHISLSSDLGGQLPPPPHPPQHPPTQQQEQRPSANHPPQPPEPTLNPLTAHLRAAIQQSLSAAAGVSGAAGAAAGSAGGVVPPGGLFVDPFLACMSRHFLPPRFTVSAPRFPAANRQQQQQPQQQQPSASASARGAASSGSNPSASNQPQMITIQQMFNTLLTANPSAPGGLIQQFSNLLGNSGNEAPGSNFFSDLLTLALSSGHLGLPEFMTLMYGDGRSLNSSREPVQEYLHRYLQLPHHLEAQLTALRPLLAGSVAGLPVEARPPSGLTPDELLLNVIRHNVTEAREQLIAANADDGFGQLLLNSFNKLIDDLISVALKSLGLNGAQRMSDRLMQQYMLSMSSQDQGGVLASPDVIHFCSSMLAERIRNRLRSGRPSFPQYLLTVPAPAAAAAPATSQQSEHQSRVLRLMSETLEQQRLPDDLLESSAASMTAASAAAATSSAQPLAPMSFPSDLAAVVAADSASIRARLTIDNQQQQQQQQSPAYKPLSDAYLSQQPHAKRRKVLPAAAQQDQQTGLDSQQQHQHQQQQPAFQLLDSLIARVNASMGQSAPRQPPQPAGDTELRAAFLDELLRRLRRRVANDGDFESNRFPSTSRHI